MEIAWEIVTMPVSLLALFITYLCVNLLLIFQCSLIARSTYEPAAYQVFLDYMYTPAVCNLYDAI